MKDIKAMQRQVQSNAAALLSVIADPQFDAGNYITDAKTRAQAVAAAANADPLFSALGERGPDVAMAWAHELKLHFDRTGEMPSDQLLSSVYQQLKNIVEPAGAEDGKGSMLLSSLNSTPMSESAGIEVRANTAALILPVLLANPLNDAIVYVPNPAKYFTEIFNVINTAGSDFGDFKKGDRIGPFSSGQYSSMRQRYPFQTAADGTVQTLVFNSANAPAGVAVPFKKGSVRVLISKTLTVVDAGKNTNPAGTIKLGATTHAIAATIDYNAGTVSINCTPALPASTDAHVEYSVDVERNPDLIPLIEQNMESFTVYPFERTIGADSNVFAALKSMSEYGINVRSSMLSSAKVWLANEKAIQQLRDMMFFAVQKTTFDATLPASGEWKEAFEAFKAKLVAISNALLKATEESGLAGMYAGSDVVNFLRMLPAELFQIAPGYTDDKRIQYVGMFMGQYKVFHVPHSEVVPTNQALCYAKGTTVGKGAYISGDVVPPMVLQQTNGRGTKNQDTVLSLGYDELHPNDGAAFLHVLEITNFTLGE